MHAMASKRTAAVSSICDMAEKIVHGARQWGLGRKIGRGGFGAVYAASLIGGESPGRFVAKLVPKAPGADREILFQSIEGAQNVVPVIDSGEDGSSYFLVMPRADYSLLDLLHAQGKIPTDDGLEIIEDVATALQSLIGKVVHRDLKPGNILHLDGSWCVSDFGISRYAEASTSPETRKFSFTPPYAAPEQWRHEHAEHGTDIYALGVTIFQMLSGRLPFPGPSEADFREQHLHVAPPALDQGPAQIKTLVAQSLLKTKEARPLAGDILRQLKVVKSRSVNGEP
jgi:serine/threonine protein kinase